MRIYDTQLRQKVEFAPIEPGHVRMYVCGPTVYNYIHIGNARTFVSFDVIRRYLEWRGLKVTFVQNVTDVDDKIIARASEEGRSASEVAAEYTDAFIQDMRALGVADPTVRPKATEEIDTMIALAERLIEEGHAYATDDGDVYFSVRSFPDYGALSGRNVDDMEAGHRDLRTAGIEDRKRDPLDFALWKAAKPEEPAWDSPWGPGRPGWHIECSCMAEKYLGLPFDIHGGGADLCFPHHENERAQSEAACGGPFARHWMHGGMLQVNSEKMSKSLGNFLLLREILKTVDPHVLRFLMLQTHYRSPLDYSPERLAEAESALGRIANAVEGLRWAAAGADAEAADQLDAAQVHGLIDQVREDFTCAMDDDFNSPKALGAVFDFVTQANSLVAGRALSAADGALAVQMADAVVELMGVFGIGKDAFQGAGGAQWPIEVVALAEELASYEGDECQGAVDALLDVRAQARAAKDWAAADAVRDRLGALGLVVKDTPQGAKVEYADA